MEIVDKCVVTAFDIECLHTSVIVEDIEDSAAGRRVLRQIKPILQSIDEKLAVVHKERFPEAIHQRIRIGHTLMCKEEGSGQVQPPHTDEIKKGYSVALTNISKDSVSIVRFYQGDVTADDFDQNHYVEFAIRPGYTVVMDGLCSHAGVCWEKVEFIATSMTHICDVDSSGEGNYYFGPLYDRCIALPERSITTATLRGLIKMRGQSRNRIWRALADKWTSELVL